MSEGNRAERKAGSFTIAVIRRHCNEGSTYHDGVSLVVFGFM
jgi:hypothetical protein